MKFLLLLPSAIQPITPHLAIPNLLGQLTKEGYDAEAIDLNIEFFNDVLKKSYLEKVVKNLKQLQIDTSIEAEKYSLTDKRIEDYPIETQAILFKDKVLKEYFENKSKLFETIPKEIEKAVSNIKKPKSFYNPLTFLKSYRTIHIALELACLPYAPAQISFHEYRNPLLKYSYDIVKYNVFSKSTNIFIDYYEKWIPAIKKKKPQFIGISINMDSQVIPGLTLASLLKKHTNAHICIFGNQFSRIAENVIKHPEFFDIFADTVTSFGGEKPIVEMAKYLNNKISIDEVPNIIYKKNDEIIINKKCTPYTLDELTPSFENYKFKKYITPKTMIPIQTSRGCYWGKCAFCDLPYGKTYSEKNVDKLINQFKTYKEKYGVTNFEILDLAIHPKHLEKIADKIIESKLKINYHCYLRTDKSLTKEILEKARRSGLRIALWGLESGSKRILNLVNKGVDFDTRMKIIQESSDADIWNHAFTIFGFPSETVDEARETLKLITKNPDIINSCSLSTFKLSRHSKANENAEQYGIKNINTYDNEFSVSCEFMENEMTQQKTDEYKKLHAEADKTIFKKSLWKYCLSIHYLFLYISHYSADWVYNHNIEIVSNKN